MLIRITQEDIENGIKHKAKGCPIALAVSRQIGTPVSVNGFGIYFLDPENLNFKGLELPNICYEFMHNFDNGRKVEPFSFELMKLSKP